MTGSALDQPVSTAVPAVFAGLFDDAAIFPPGDASTATAVHDHLGSRQRAFAGTVGAFVCGAGRLGEVDEVLVDRGSGGGAGKPLAINLIVAGGADVADALDRCAALPRVRVAALEVALVSGRSDQVAAARAAADVDHRIPIYVELPAAALTSEVADEFRRLGLRVKLRTGGLTQDAFPEPVDLARAISSCVDAALPFKCTAGLHNAVRHRDDHTGLTHFGFLNVLLTVDARLAGTTDATTLARLIDDDAERVAAAVRGMTEAGADRVRTLFRSFGTCSITQPVADLVALRLLDTA